MTYDAWGSQYAREHVAVWTRSLRARGLGDESIRDEVRKWTIDGVTQICLGQYARSMPVALARAMVEDALEESIEST